MTTRQASRLTIDQANEWLNRMGFTRGIPTTTRNAAARGGWLTTYAVTDPHGVTVTLTAKQVGQLIWLYANK